MCDKGENFDGNGIGILNMGRYLFSHEVLRDYMNHFFFGRYTFASTSAPINFISFKYS